MDISNGPGIRVALFTQGCPHHCKGCFNPETWSFDGGKDFTLKVKDDILNLCADDHCAGLSILGGEPLIDDNYVDLKDLLTSFRRLYPNKTIWLWTGYTIENLTNKQMDIVKLCNIIIDGPFIADNKDINLYYAGSTNQRMWEVLDNGILGQLIMKKNGSTNSQ